MFRNGEVNVLVVWKYDRLSGDPVQQSVIVYEIEEKSKGKILSTREQFEDGPVGQLLRYVMSYSAKMEKESIRLRTSRAMEHRIENGFLLPHPKPLYGYDFADARKTRYVINPETAPIVERIFRQIAAGIPRNSIILALEADGIPGPRGKRWDSRNIKRMVDNPAYWGRPQINRTRQVKRTVTDPLTGDTKTVYRQVPREDPTTLPPETCPAIVSIEVARQAHAVLSLSTASPVRVSGELFMLRGFIYCGHCGRLMTCHNQLKDHTRQYRCLTTYLFHHRHDEDYRSHSHMISQRLIDREAWKAVRAWLSHPEMLEEAMRARADQLVEPDVEEEDTLKQLIARAGREEDNLLRMLREQAAEEDPNMMKVWGLIKAAQQDAKEAKARLDMLRERHTLWNEFQTSIQTNMQQCQTILGNLSPTWEEKRRVMRAIGFRVDVWKTGLNPRRYVFHLEPLEAILPLQQKELRERYARGEIELETFAERVKTLLSERHTARGTSR
jgi:site-specific DNA recombinase